MYITPGTNHHLGFWKQPLLRFLETQAMSQRLIVHLPFLRVRKDLVSHEDGPCWVPTADSFHPCHEKKSLEIMESPRVLKDSDRY